MQRSILAVWAAGLISMSSIVAAADVGVSINIGEPGFFGRIDLRDAPAPQLLNPSPIVVFRPPGVELPPPVYLHVPPGYERHWRRYCHEYNACGEPVFFVRDDWYNRVYVPHYREHHRDHFDGRDDRDHRDDHRDHRDDEHRDHHDDDHRDHRDDHR